jgi:sec-independent protein translocase protein TatA
MTLAAAGLPFGGPWELLIIAFIVVLIFGVGRLPEVGGALGKGIREFRKSTKDDDGDAQASLDAGAMSAAPAGPSSNTPAAPSANADTSAGTRFCNECGEKNAASAKFCAGCGHSMSVLAS